MAALCLIWAMPAASAPTQSTTAYAAGSNRAVGTATIYADGAEIRTHFVKEFTISPLDLTFSSKPPYPIAGDRVTITVSISNTGGIALERISPTLEIQSGSGYISSLSGPSPSGPVRIAPGAAESFAWIGSILSTGPIRLKAGASGFLSGQNAPVSGQATHELTSITVAQLAAELTPNPMEVTGGKWFTLTVTVSNTGGLLITGVLPSLEAASGAGLVTFKEGPVPKEPVSLHPGGSQDFTFTFSANGSGIVSFSTTVQGQAELDPPGFVKRTSSQFSEKTHAAWQISTETAGRWIINTWHWINPPAPPLPAEQPFLGFESERDLAWDTGGYVELAWSSEHATEGGRSCRAVFLLPGSMSSTSSDGAFQPTFRRTAPARGTLPPLEPRDWASFTALRVDCYNSANEILDLQVTLVDLRGFEFQALPKLPPAGATTIEVSMESARQAMLNPEAVSELRFSIDTTRLKEKPAVFFDNFRFALPAPSISTTTASSTVFRQTAKP